MSGVVTDGKRIPAELVLPAVVLARQAGIDLGASGAIAVSGRPGAGPEL